ncbi:hypothetical protein ES705_27732 [subsurface metagenome]
MATVKRFEELEIWQMTRKLSIEIFKFILKDKFLRDNSLHC